MVRATTQLALELPQTPQERWEQDQPHVDTLEALRWPDGPICPHCGSKRMSRRAGAKRPPGYNCLACNRISSVRTGTLLAHTATPLAVWIEAVDAALLQHPQEWPRGTWAERLAPYCTDDTARKLRLALGAEIDRQEQATGQRPPFWADFWAGAFPPPPPCPDTPQDTQEAPE